MASKREKRITIRGFRDKTSGRSGRALPPSGISRWWGRWRYGRMRFCYGIFIVAAALEIRVHRPICLANESLLIYGIYELQTLVSLLVHLYAEAIRMFSGLYLNNEDFYFSHSGFWVSLMKILWSILVLYYSCYPILASLLYFIVFKNVNSSLKFKLIYLRLLIL